MHEPSDSEGMCALLIACGFCGRGSGHWSWCPLATNTEPVDVHNTWCQVWQHPTNPCDCWRWVR